jgi:formate C-acetyltransferase
MEELEGRCFGDSAKKYTFYKAITIVCDAAMLFPKRYAALCREKAADAPEPRKSELLEMAESLDWILENPVRTFREAIQALLLYQILMILEGDNHAISWAASTSISAAIWTGTSRKAASPRRRRRS